MRRSKLSDHTFQKGKFITPINAIPLMHELEDEKSWTYGRMPEYLWIGLILKYYGRDEGLRKSYGIISALHKLAPGLYTARLSQILKLDADIQKRFYDYIICSGAKEALAPLTVFLTASKAPVFAECFYCPDQSIEDRCEVMIQTMREIMDHQSNEATDIRFVALYFNQLSGKVHLLKEQVDLLVAYFAKCNSIDDIIRFAREDIGRLVMFSEDDNVMLPFGERFRGALSGTKYMVDRAKPDSYNFFILVFGCIQQAIDVLVSCIEYGCIPYIRYPVSLHYISLLSESMLDIEHMVKLRFKMSVAFVVYQLCDKGRLARVSLEEFLKQIQAYNFNEKLFRVLAEHDINENSFLGHTITQLVIDELEAFYNILAEESGI